jgi:VIT1/CCC1 family predicted Fe2+/Mn2+ transporter
VNNFYDGMLTILGVLLGFFVILIRNPNQTISSSYVVLTGLGTSISMLISGLSGSYLSEKAEQKKGRKELVKAMAIIEEEKEAEMNLEIEENEINEIQKAMVVPPKDIVAQKKRRLKFKTKKMKRKAKTLHEKAESFTGIIVSLVNGISPFLGGVVAILPFFYVKTASFNCFISSFIIIFVCIILLGVFLGKISQDSILKNILQMLAAFTITIIITIVFLGV